MVTEVSAAEAIITLRAANHQDVLRRLYGVADLVKRVTQGTRRNKVVIFLHWAKIFLAQIDNVEGR